MDNAPKWYDAHLEEYRKIAYIKSMEEYKELYRRSLEDADNFWSEAAKAVRFMVQGLGFRAPLRL